MSDRFTKHHIDFSKVSGLLSPRRQLELRGVGIGVIRLPAGEGYTFTHSHREQEEVYMVIEGSGEILLDGKIEKLTAGDFIRVDPAVRRALRAGDEAMLVICVGGVPAGFPKNPNARYLIDDGIPHYDDPPPWCADDPKAIETNRKLAERMAAAKSRREEE